MAHFDVFNGDADGICALHQLRLAAPMPAKLITGPKHDVSLLARANARHGDSITVLDISLDANRTALNSLLERGVRVEYFDHHFAGTIPTHGGLIAHIDTSPDVCTSILVDRHLSGRHHLWAIAAAFGDNLVAPAHVLAQSAGLSAGQTQQLRSLGEALNYNGYGRTEADLLIAPDKLYEALRPYSNAFEFIAAEPLVPTLTEEREADLARARQCLPHVVLQCGALHVLPDAAWSWRVQGAFANELANAAPKLAHAVLVCDAAGGYAAARQTR
ncbi:acetyltransferase [Paraburkholderia sp. NMBU_R16]|uniref:acetyltransferase n=1 Tax=Paraburkholderia sp. NMBU_R16 TaxID=2698676 RepID=UPI0015645A7A|nr:acetyltransferase [Paraburkholderia sp. NMBU_R16]NRO96981.1 acetyltransferase [Paraburkholderia sp. NMBU_R16]